MANEIKTIHGDGAETVYAIVRHMDGTWRDVVAGAGAGAWDPYLVADWADYDIAMAEVDAGGAGVNVALQGLFPVNVAAGYYWVDFYIQAGGAAVSTDTHLRSTLFYWNATTLVPAETATNIAQISGSATAADNVEAVFTGAGAAADVDLEARSLTINNDAGVGIDVDGSTSGMTIDGASGQGLDITGSSSGLSCTGTAAYGLTVDGSLAGIIANGLGAGAPGILAQGLGAAISASGTTFGINATASAGPGALFQGTTYGISAQATGGTGIYAYGQDTNGHGIHAKGDATEGGTGSGIYAEAGAVAPGFYAKGGATSGPGIYAAAAANNDAGMQLVKNGTGVDLDADELGYLLAKACGSNDITNAVVDQSVIAALLAVDGDISDYDDNTDSQEAIKVAVDTMQTAITAGFPTHVHADAEPDGGIITTGNQEGENDGDETFTDDGSYWQVAATTAVGGFGLNIHQVFTLGTTAKANIVKINAKESFTGVVIVWAYNYVTSAWEAISDTITGISGNSDQNYEYILNSDHQKTDDGEVKIRYTSTDTSAVKYLYLDSVVIGTVAATALTASEIAQAVAEQDVEQVRHSETGEMLLGHLAKRDIALGTTVATENTTTSFTLTAGTAVADAYNGMVIEVRDESSGTRDIEARRIVDWTDGRVVTVDRAFSFTPTTADTVHIHNKYADVNVQAISEDSTAADNVEDFFDDATSVTNFKAMYDGTGYAGGTIVFQSDITKIHGTAITETTGRLAAAFTKFFNVASPTATCLSLPDAVPNAAGGVLVTAAGSLDCDATDANVTLILADSNELQGDWKNGGRLDLIVDAILADTVILTGGDGGTTITITVNDPDGDPLNGVSVYINTDTGGADSGIKIAGVNFTNSSGEVQFALDDGAYWVHASLTGYDFTTTYPRSLTISGGAVSWT